MYIGIDLGTSGVKVVAISREGKVLASASEPLTVSRPKPLWSEQDPLDWWLATNGAIKTLQSQCDFSQVKAIGFSGQMHGATLLDQNNEVLRPAILWNDGRCKAECDQLEAEVVDSREITGNIMMPGFTAPKLKWVANHEPDIFAKVNKVLLPKDYLRFLMTGEFVSEMSDASGTLWMDVGKRDWNDDLLNATGLTRSNMPTLVEGTEVTGYLSLEVALEWGMNQVPVVGGGGDNAAGAAGVGIINPGQAMLSLGTSGVYFSVNQGFIANPESALHSFCHALPNTWHTMSVILSAASCLDWVQSLTGFDSVGDMLEQVEANANPDSSVTFLPYLSGERTPHNDPEAKGVFFGMTHSTTKYELVQAVLEGVGFAFADGLEALHGETQVSNEISLIGGGARSRYWRQMLADILQVPMVYREGGEVGPALGAARLAILGTEPNLNAQDICPVPPLVERHEPTCEQIASYQAKRKTYQALYLSLKDLF
ncbi:xylulokinase [Vibrio sp. SCSIO 43136]|uniref:xylulokinase n=1 Tax=Vibrio sp. SCSIO 43136 TaxID=2819101 RepID=UPI00207555AF|nr:xylulokinase [Vibrio sp. SCSIO 43136]USD67693.1 xylulokinase [Vibrio sp. SCSIO 43136]